MSYGRAENQGNVVRDNQLIREALVAVREVDDAAVPETGFPDAVLHDVVVTVGVDAEVALPFQAPCDDVGEHPVSVRETGDAVDYMVRQRIVHPTAALDHVVSWFRRRHEGEIGNDTSIVFNDESPTHSDIFPDGVRRRIPVRPLVGVPALTHDAPCRIQHGQDGGDVGRRRRTDISIQAGHGALSVPIANIPYFNEMLSHIKATSNLLDYSL